MSSNANIGGHSIITATIDISDYSSYQNEINTDNISNGPDSNSSQNIHFNPQIENPKKYKKKSVPNSFFEDVDFRNNIVELIDKILIVNNQQQEIDKIYSDFILIYSKQVDEHLDPVNFNSNSRIRKNPKPWWNPDLTTKWKAARSEERLLLKSRYLGRPREEIYLLSNSFKIKRTAFDKSFQKAKRSYQREWQINVEKLDVNKPRQFWNEVNKLKPKTKSGIPMEVYDDFGNVLTDTESVLGKWKSEYEKLFNIDHNYPNTNFDNDFYLM